MPGPFLDVEDTEVKIVSKIPVLWVFLVREADNNIIKKFIIF